MSRSSQKAALSDAALGAVDELTVNSRAHYRVITSDALSVPRLLVFPILK